MNPFASAVNQKLFLAQLSLKQNNAQQHVELALCQAALFQLMNAYKLYLNEIANHYKLPVERRFSDLPTLNDALLAADKHPPETTEIANLLNQPTSWLVDFFAAFKNAQEPQSLALHDKQSLISSRLLDSSEQFVEVDFQQVSHYLSCFSEMLHRHRELMIES